MATRLAALWALVLAAAVGISSWMAHRDAREQLLGNLRRTVEQDAGVARLRLETWVRNFRDDAQSTSQSPLLVAFLKSRATPEEPLWRGLVEDEFRAAFSGKSSYFQMRLLQMGGEEDGREILRLDRRGQRLQVTPRERLQPKAGRTYYQEALGLPSGSIYLSRINLNRDFGGVTQPHIPTLRAAAIIESEAGQRAMLIINADLRDLFMEVRDLMSPSSAIELADEEGDFLMHPDPKARFATDLEHARRMASRASASEGLSSDRAVSLGGWPSRSLALRVSLPEAAWRPALQQSSRRGIWATALASLAGGAAAIVLVLPFTHRLRKLSMGLREFDARNESDALPPSDNRQDEIGIAIERFREMALKVRQQVEDLQRARDEAQAANEAKETFLAVMSHEIRTPMNAVVGLIRALDQNSPSPHQQPILNSLRASAVNLMTLLNTALDYTRLREGVMEYASDPFDASVVVREVAEGLRPSALAKRLELRLTAPEEMRVKGDSIRMRQVISNLLNNAIKFTEEGEVAIALSGGADELKCVVSDSGPGIAAADQERVFEPFYTHAQGQAEARGMPGAGLGLSVSRQMLEEQGGSLQLESEEGQGAQFTVRLPYPLLSSTMGGDSERAMDVRDQELRHGLRILCVEDLLSNQEVMAYTLEPAGVDLTFADTAEKALRLIEEEVFDLVMVDLQLPDLSGTELARRILQRRPGMPIMAVTAQSSAVTDPEVKALGIREVVLKPYTDQALFSAIQRQTRSWGLAWEALRGLHPEAPEKVERLARSMAQEFRAAALEMEEAASGEDWEQARRVFRGIRHRLTTALAQFSLEDLKDELDRLAASKRPGEVAIASCSGALRAVAAELEQRPCKAGTRQATESLKS